MKTTKTPKILLSGGSGLLGSALRMLDSTIVAPSSRQMNILNKTAIQRWIRLHKPDIFFHAAAFIHPPDCEKDPMNALRVNIIGTCNVVEACAAAGIRLIYISTDYVYKGDRGNYKETDEILPQNKYTWSKLGGECAVKLYENSLILRTSFSPDVFPYEKAFDDQYTSRDKVSVIAPMMLALAKMTDVKGIVNVGTKRKTVKQLAIQLGKKNVIGIKRSKIMADGIHDTSFNLDALHALIAK